MSAPSSTVDYNGFIPQYVHVCIKFCKFNKQHACPRLLLIKLNLVADTSNSYNKDQVSEDKYVLL